MTSNNANTTMKDIKPHKHEDVLAALNLAYGSINDIGGLFAAIATMSHEHCSITKVAKIGQYICDDWANNIDVEREKIEYPERFKS